MAPQLKAGLLGCLLLLVASEALAHRLDEYLQAIRVSVTTNRLDLSFAFTPGVAVADPVLAVIDQNQDGRFSKEERAAYAQSVLKDIRLGLDGSVLTLRVADISFPRLHDIKGGLGVIRIKATAPIGPMTAGQHTFRLTNSHLPAISVYQVNAVTPKDQAVKITKQTRDVLQKNYLLEFGVNPAAP